MLKEIIVGLVVAAIMGLGGYILIVKENQVVIEQLQKSFTELKELEMKTTDSLYATRLFVASAHPERDMNLLVSYKKLEELSNEELQQLAAGIRMSTESSPTSPIVTATHTGPKTTASLTPTHILAAYSDIRDKYNLTEEDISAFKEAVVTVASY